MTRSRYVVEHPSDNNIYGTHLREDNIDVTKGISACDAIVRRLKITERKSHTIAS